MNFLYFRPVPVNGFVRNVAKYFVSTLEFHLEIGVDRTSDRSGFEKLKSLKRRTTTLKSLQLYRHLPVVVLTEYGGTQISVSRRVAPC